MKADYTKGKIKLYRCDCMDFMREVPDKYFELAIVDPPYGESCDILGKGNRQAARNGFSDLYVNNNSHEWNIKPDAAYFEELFRISKNQIIWGYNFFQLPQTASVIVWNKMQRNFSFGDGELAWCSIGKKMKIFDLSRAEAVREKRIHITQKPVKLYNWLLANYAKPGDKIFDSHGGSFSLAVACLYAGFEFDGCEIDEDYFNAAVNRLENHNQLYLDI